MMYKVYDSLGNCLRSFSTYKEAANYKFIFGNPSWTINYT